MGDFLSFCLTMKAFPETATFATFKMLPFLDCLFVFLHRIRPHVAVVVDGIEHQADVIMTVFNPTPEKFGPEFFSAVQIYIFTIYCKSALEFETKRGKKISVRMLETRGTPKMTVKRFSLKLQF